MFTTPNRIDVTATKMVPTPKSWKGRIAAAEVPVLPLVDRPRIGMAGWCTAGAGLEDSPEVEVMCGGINTKTPQHAALWRQGHLVHFGFEESPAQLNATGRALLENAICYAARFTDDRPIVVTRSSFLDRSYPRSRQALRLAIAPANVAVKTLAAYFGEPHRAALEAMTRADAKRWIEEKLGFLVTDATGRLVVDPQLEALGVALDDPGFFARALAAAEVDASAIALLARRVPEGPGAEASLAAWRQFAEQRQCLFFSEAAGYVWRLDPLARKLGVASAELRGPRRASR